MYAQKKYKIELCRVPKIRPLRAVLDITQNYYPILLLSFRALQLTYVHLTANSPCLERSAIGDRLESCFLKYANPSDHYIIIQLHPSFYY